jgi:hypothetical protein
LDSALIRNAGQDALDLKILYGGHGWVDGRCFDGLTDAPPAARQRPRAGLSK